MSLGDRCFRHRRGKWVTTAFGEIPPSTGATGFVQETADTAPAAGATDPVTFDLRYPGQVADEESGLYYNLHRSYNPTTGRYTQTDPVGLATGLPATDLLRQGLSDGLRATPRPIHAGLHTRASSPNGRVHGAPGRVQALIA
ncbi:RHS repeat-associated core domain-containing protein [Xylophilus sp. GW821-FHT01B05]